jgi:transposase-like protein
VDRPELNNMRVPAKPLLMIEVSKEAPHENPHQQFCHNLRCRAYGRCGEDHIVIHSHKERRYRCKRCGRTFTETKDTAF